MGADFTGAARQAALLISESATCADGGTEKAPQSCGAFSYQNVTSEKVLAPVKLLLNVGNIR